MQEPIDGRFGKKGGGLTLEAGNAIEVNNDFVTNDGPVTLRAGAGGILMGNGLETSVTQGNGVVIHAGSGAINLESRGDVTVQHLVTTGRVAVCSGQAGAITCAAPTVTFRRDLGGTLGDGIGALSVNAGRKVQLAGVKTIGAVDVKTLDAEGTIALEGPIAAGGKVIIGDPARSGLPAINATTIKLSSDIHSQGSDIELNGRVLVNPRATRDNIVYLTEFPFVTDDQARVYEVPMVQVSLQTIGGGSVRFRGDVVWDHAAPPNNALKYIYNAERPAGFVRNENASIDPLRSSQPPRATGYYGLNIAVATGSVEFRGNLGTLDAAGNSTTVTASTTTPGVSPKDVLGESNPANGLVVKVSTGVGTQRISFAAGSMVEVPLFRVIRPAGIVAIETRTQFSAAGRPQSFKLLPGGNLPDVRVDDGNPNEIGPGPRNVARATNFERVAALPDVPLEPRRPGAQPPDPGPLPDVPRAGTGETPFGTPAAVADRTVFAPAQIAGSAPGYAHDLAQEANIARGTAVRGAAPDVFEYRAPLVSGAASTPAADADYFSQGAFEFAQTLSERARPGE